MAEVIFETEKIMVLQAQLGDWDNLNHLLVCKKTSKAAIVDPFEASYWLNICQNNGWELEQAWLTHSHWDHSKGVGGLTHKEIWVHEKESERGWDGPSNREWNHQPLSHVIQRIGELEFEVHCSPGHTPGHVTFIGNGLVISGDCLFLGRCGRTDLFGGSEVDQRDSLLYLRDIMVDLPQEWLVLPGHQYSLSDGICPTFISVGELLQNNEALAALDDDNAWKNLEFLAFDDSLAEKARRERAINSKVIEF